MNARVGWYLSIQDGSANEELLKEQFETVALIYVIDENEPFSLEESVNNGSNKR